MPGDLDRIHLTMMQNTLNSGTVRKPADAVDPSGMRKACSAFESLFVNYLMKEMRDTIPENTLFGGGSAEKIYTGMLDGEVAKQVSSHRGIGLADMLMEQMVRDAQKKE